MISIHIERLQRRLGAREVRLALQVDGAPERLADFTPAIAAQIAQAQAGAS